MLYDLDKLNIIKDKLLKSKKTLSVAESVTSGHLQAAFSAATDAGKFFQGGLTAYNAGQKSRHLNIEPIYAIMDNCVSQQVAEIMATEVNKLFLSDYGIGITGYAATVPELNVHSLFAFVAIANNDKIIVTQKITCIKGDSIEAQVDYTCQVIDLFLSALNTV